MLCIHVYVMQYVYILIIVWIVIVIIIVVVLNWLNLPSTYLSGPQSPLQCSAAPYYTHIILHSNQVIVE